MNETELVEFPYQSVNESGELEDIGLWIDEFELYFDNRIVGEIKSTIDADLRTAPYILISCAIDFLVTFWANADSTRSHYRDFVNIFFEGYDGNNLYKELRCRMVHNHTVGDRAIICWQEPGLHKTTISDGTIVLNLEQFFEDFLLAKDKYFAALRISPTLISNHINRFNDMGVLCSLNPDDVRKWVDAG